MCMRCSCSTSGQRPFAPARAFDPRAWLHALSMPDWGQPRHLRLRGLQQQHHSVVPLHQAAACGLDKNRVRIHRRPSPCLSVPAAQRGTRYAALPSRCLLLGCGCAICLAAFLQAGNT